MGIAPYKTFTFDGESSGDYGVYITGTGVFNAPERSVEMVEIAGRNGSFALDKGKFENIEVTYRVGIVDDSEADFADRVSDFRNWLCSKVGYCRLEDEYNPNEYRMAVYASGMELEHDLLIAGEAEITFNCKPQRWLKSGETAVTVAYGGTLDNPTLFESEPLLAVEGYGNISFNGYSIDIENAVLGDVIVADNDSFEVDKTYTFNSDSVNIGDEITLNATFETLSALHAARQATTLSMSSQSKSDTNASFTTKAPNFQKYTSSSTGTERYQSPFITSTSDITLTVGTSATLSNTATLTISGTGTGTGSANIGAFVGTFTMIQTITYDSATSTINIHISRSCTTTNSGTTVNFNPSKTIKNVRIVMHSTKSVLANTNYIDCEIGECYFFSDGEIVSINNIVSLDSDLPKLVSGTNTFNYDNTITDFKVTPRWWKV